MTKDQQIENIVRFGYTAREASFLALAALHSGYFLRRQYCTYLGVGFGYPDDSLTSKLLRLGHAREHSLRYRRRLYHIHSKPLYAALGEADNRNRRAHDPLTIRARLMGLDYFLRTSDATWYPTETDRVSLFVDQLGIGKEYLPVRRYAAKRGAPATLRYFVDKPPTFTLPGDKTVHVCFVDPGYHTCDGFTSFLENYIPLISRMERSGVVYLTCYAPFSGRARATFERLVSPSRSAPVDPILADLLEYFEDRREHETVGLAGFDLHRLNRYRDARRELRNTRYDQLFTVWKVNGEEAIRRTISPESSADLRRRCSFSVCVLEENYDLFSCFRSAHSTRFNRNDAPQVSL
jgi:hypothetical protein